MDLAGPKVRTRSTSLEIRPIKISVPKDVYGKTVRMVEGFIDREAQFTEKITLVGVSPSFVISIKEGHDEVPNLEIGESLSFHDSRGRHRTLIVLEKVSSSRVRIGLGKTAFLQEDITLYRQNYGKNSNKQVRNRTKSKAYAGGSIEPNIQPTGGEIHENETNEEIDNDENRRPLKIGRIAAQPTDVLVRTGDRILLRKKEANVGSDNLPFISNAEHGKYITGEVSCNLPGILAPVQVGHHVYIDDGKIGSIVRSSTDEYLELEILSPSDTTAKIKPEKGLNFPDSKLDLPALTSEDSDNLNFIVKNATAAGLSFAHSPDDIKSLHEKLSSIEKPDFGIIAKVETSDAVTNLAKVLLAGLDLPNFGILIARGDLAVEMGFEILPAIQEDILCMCEAAHIPVILATQVLETMAKSGLPTRAEMIDAAFGQRAECVMLNKGKHILEAVKMLSLILGSEEGRHLKKRQIFREFTKQSGFP
jgi:pyruvate kinase